MPGEQIAIQRPTWKREYLALLCGIANAGGGTLTIEDTKWNQGTGFRRKRRLIDLVPEQAQEALGIICTAEPVMKGGKLCLEIIVPAAELLVSFEGKYYLVQNGKNVVVDPDMINDLRSEDQEVKAVEDVAERPLIVPQATSKTAAFREKSFAAANDLDLTATDEFVLKVLHMNGRATAKLIASGLGCSEVTVRRSFRKLRELGLIQRIGSDKAGWWKTFI